MAFRELSPNEEVVPFAPGEIPATYGGPINQPKGGFRELSPDEEILPLKPPSLAERATGAIKSAASTVKEALPPLPSMPSIPSLGDIGARIKSTFTTPAPTPSPTPGYNVDEQGNVFDQATGKNILDNGPAQPQAPLVTPPVTQNPNPLAGIKERLRSIIPAKLPSLPEGTQVAEMPDMGANIPSAIKEPVPPPRGLNQARVEQDQAQSWKARLNSLATAAKDYFSAEPAHEFTPPAEDVARAVPVVAQGLGKGISDALVTTLTPPLNTPAAQKMVPFPGMASALQGKPPLSDIERPTGRMIDFNAGDKEAGPDLYPEMRPLTDVGALLNPIPEIVSDAFKAGKEAISSIKPEFYPTLGQDIAGALDTALMNAPGSPHVPLGQALRYAKGRLFGDWGKINPEIAAKLSTTEPLRDLSPEDAAALNKVVSSSSDAHIQAAMKALDPEIDPRYAIYAAEWQRRQGGGRPEAPPSAAPPKPGGEQPPGPTGGALPAPEGFKEISPETPIEPLPGAPKGGVTFTDEQGNVKQAPVKTQYAERPVNVKQPAPEGQRVSHETETPPPAVSEKPPEVKPQAQVASAEGAKERLANLKEQTPSESDYIEAPLGKAPPKHVGYQDTEGHAQDLVDQMHARQAREAEAEAKAPAEAPKVEEPSQAEPWQRTQADYVNAIKEKHSQPSEPTGGLTRAQHLRMVASAAEHNHEIFVADAVKAGKPVPPEVLADYPDLGAQPKVEEPSQPTTAAPGTVTGYDNAKAQATFRQFKTRLTRAQNAKDWPKVIEEVNAFEDYYNKSPEPFPDDWNRWKRAKEDAELAIRREGPKPDIAARTAELEAENAKLREAAKAKAAERVSKADKERGLEGIGKEGKKVFNNVWNKKMGKLSPEDSDYRDALYWFKQLYESGKTRKPIRNKPGGMALDGDERAAIEAGATDATPKPTLLSKPPPGGFTEADKVPQFKVNQEVEFDAAGETVRGKYLGYYKGHARVQTEDGLSQPPISEVRPAATPEAPPAKAPQHFMSESLQKEELAKLEDELKAFKRDRGFVVPASRPVFDKKINELETRIAELKAKAPEPQVKPEYRPGEHVAFSSNLEGLTKRWRQLMQTASDVRDPSRSAQLITVVRKVEDEIRAKYGDDAVGKVIADWKQEKARPKTTEEILAEAKAKQAETTKGSFKAEVSDGSGFAANSLRFATKEEAQAYADDLMSRWMAAKESRVVPSDEPVNRKWVNGKAEPIDTAAEQAQIEKEGEGNVRQPVKSTAPVDVRQRAGVREGVVRQETPAGTGEEHPEPGDTGVAANEQAPGAGNELRPGIRSGPSVRNPEGRAGVHRPGEAGAAVSGGPGENIEGAGGSGGVSGPSTEATPREVERYAHQNHVLPKDHDWIPSGAKTRVRANIAAIKLLKRLDAEDRFATPQEKEVLASYTGWGAFPQIFDEGKAAYRKNPPINAEQKTEAQNWEKNWGELYNEVKGALTPEERTAASRSLLNAHYTSREVVNKVWDAVEKLGFKGGKALEPAVGVGNFIGLTPDNIRNKTKWTAVELDNISAGIAKKLYPESDVIHSGFQDVPLKRDYDLVITNVPFNATGPSTANPRHLSLHNFFIDRSINELKPGGVAALITSDSTMDRPISENARRLISEKADLVGAIRLPNTAFKGNAGTEVTTDVLFFRKKDDLSHSGQFKGQPFIETKPAETYKGEPVKINEYYVAHPDMMLGRMSLEGTMYRKPEPDQSSQALLPYPDKDLGELFDKAIEKLPKLPKGVGDTANAPETKAEPSAPKAEGKEFQPGSYALDKAGDVKFINSDGRYETPEWASDPKKVAQAKRYIALRDAALDLINKEATDVPDASLEPARKELNKLYDDYVKRYGAINLKASRFLEDDYHFNTPITLEKEVSKITERKNAKGDLIPTKQTSYVKDTIFSKRAGFHHQEPTSADTVEEGLDLSMNQKGAVDTQYIAKLTGKDVAEVEESLRRSGLAFENPKTKKWEDRTEYLSGFTKLKLKDAQKAAEKDRRFQTNVDELEKVQPEPIAIEDITTNVGSDWIPKEHYQKFIEDTLGLKTRIHYAPTTSTWEIQPLGNANELKNEANMNVYGVRGDTEIVPGEEPEEIVPKPALAILNDMLNGRQTEVQKRIHVYNESTGGEDIRYRKSEKKTLEAQEKRRQLQQKFNEFVRGDEARSKELEALYNEKKNIAVLPEFPVPTWKHYPGANPEITLRDDQKKDVSRMLRNSVGIFQAPGNGKTFIATTAGMELRRLGLAKKVLYVVHNATAEQAPKAVKRLYPAANVLAPTKRDFEAKNRQRLLGRIATGDYDMIIIPQSFANLIPDSPVRMIAYTNDRLSELRAAIIEARRAGGERSPTAKNLQKKVDALEKRIDALQKLRKDKGLTFEQLGVDALIVDEAHEYKSLDFDTQMGNIKGLANLGGDRGKYALSMYMKMRHVQEKTGGKNTYFLTGTPINNTIGESWTMMRFLRPDILEAYGITNFDQFAAQFGRIATKPEFTAAGTWHEVTRFEGFENAPTILKAWLENSSVVTQEMIDLPGLPPIKGGKPRGVLIQQTPEFQKYIKYLRRRLEDYAKLDGKAKRQLSYIPIVTQGLGAKASLDMRMVDPTAPDRPESKLSVSAKDIYDIYKETTPVKGTQMIFADIRYDDPDDPKFDLYKELKRKLIAHGIPEKEIVIMEDNIQGARRAAVFEAFGRGDIRIAIGHSQRMGVGVDAPEHGVGVHDLDAPHQPMFIEQRHARIVRQGNIVALKRGVDVVTYGVDGSLDAARWQRLSGKQRAFDQLMRGNAKGKFVADPLNELEFSFQEQLALYSGDPRAAEKVQLETAVRQMQGLKKSHEQSVRRAKERLPELAREIPEQKAKIKSAEADAKRLADAFKNPDAIDLQMAGSSYKGTPSDFRGEDPKYPILSNFFKGELAQVKPGKGEYSGPKTQFVINGVPVVAQAYAPADWKDGGYNGPRRVEDAVVHWRFDVPNSGWRQASGPQGFFMGLKNEIESIADEPKRLSDKLATMERNQRELQGFEKQPFDRAAELERSQKRLEELTQELQAEGPAKEPNLAELEADEDAIQHYALLDAARRLKYSTRNLEAWQRKVPKDEDAATERDKQIAKLELRVAEATQDIEEIKSGARRRDLTKVQEEYKAKRAGRAAGESLDAISSENQSQVQEARKAEKQRGSIILPSRGRPKAPSVAPTMSPTLNAALNTTARKDFRDSIAEIKERFMRVFEYEREVKDQPAFVDALRRFQGARQRAFHESGKDLDGITGNLKDRRELMELSGIVQLRDMISRLKSGQKVQAGVDLAEAEKGLKELTDAASPAVLDAVERHFKVVRAIGNEKVERGWMAPEAVRDDYFRHRVLMYADKNRIGRPSRIRPPGKEKAAKGSTLPIERDYLKVMFDYIAEHRFKKALDDFIDTQAKKLDKSKEVEKAMGEGYKLRPGQIVEIGGRKIKGFQFDPGNYIYPEITELDEGVNRGVKKALEGDRIGEIDEEGEPETRKRLIIGRKKPTYALDLNVANRLEKFSGPNIDSDLVRAINKATGKWKGVTINFGGTAFQLMNFAGDVANISRADLGSIGYIPKAARLLLRNDIDAKLLLKLADELEVIQSGFIGSEVTRLLETPEFRRFNTRWRNLKDAPGIAADRVLAAGEFRENIPRLALFMKNLARLEGGEKALLDTLKKVPSGERLAPATEKLKAATPLKTAEVNVEGLPPVHGAAKVAREIPVDYRKFTEDENRFLRGMFLPFYAWAKQNASGWARFAWKHPGKFTALVLAPWMMMELWNNLVFPEDEDGLKKYLRENPHLITGFKDESGKMIVLDLGGFFSPAAAAQVFGLGAVPSQISALMREKTTLSGAAKRIMLDVLKSPLSNLGNLVTPYLKIPYEIGRNKTIFSGSKVVPAGKEGTAEERKLQTRYAVEGLFRPAREARSILEQISEDRYDLASSRYGLGLPLRKSQGEGWIEKFYEIYDDKGEAKKTEALYKRQHRAQDRRDYREENRADIQQAGYLKQTADKLAQLRRAQDIVRENNDLTPNAKRVRIDALTTRMVQYAKQAVERSEKRSAANQ